MTDVYKILGSVAPANALGNVIYTTPSTQSAIVTGISIANRSATDQVFSIHVFGSVVSQATVNAGGYVPPAQTSLYRAVTVRANDTEFLNPGITLDANNTLVVFLTANLSATVFGVELDDLNKYKILGQVGALDEPTTIYTVPSGKSAVIKAINIANTSSTKSAILNMSFGPGEAATQTYSNFLVTGINQAAMTTDGATWGAPFNVSNYFYRNQTAASTNKYLLAAGSPHALVKRNGFANSISPIDTASSVVAFGNNVFVRVAGRNSASSVASYSTNGVTWTTTTMPSSQRWSAVTFANNRFVAVSGASGVPSTAAATSINGITWTAATLPSSSTWTSVAFGNNVFAAVSGDGVASTAAATSTDGTTWVARTLPTSSQWRSIAFGNGAFATVSNSTAGLRSTDGITWTASTLPNSFWSQVAFGNGIFLAGAAPVGTTNIATSTNGTTWTARSIGWPSGTDTYYGTDSVVFGALSDYTSNREYSLYNYLLLPSEVTSIKSGITLQAGAQVRAESISGLDTAINIFGVEL
jgi:hypothetical protein